MNRARRAIHWFVGIVAFMLALLPAPVRASEAGGALLEQAMEALARFEADVLAMQQAARTPLGPYPVQTRCSWCMERAWWGFGTCTKTGTESFNTTVDFTWTRQDLGRALERTQQDMGSLTQAWQPAQAWFGNLAAFSLQFERLADRVSTVQEQLRQGIGPNAEQRLTVTAALAALARDMERSAVQLESGTRALAMVAEVIGTQRERIGAAMASSTASAREALQQFERKTQPMHCQDELRKKFSIIHADFDRSASGIANAYERLAGSSAAAQKAMGILLGDVVARRSDIEAALELVRAAQEDQLGGMLERLHLNAARQLFQQMAAAQIKVRSNVAARAQ